MELTIEHTPEETQLRKGLMHDAINVTGEFRLFDRDDCHTLVLVSFGPHSDAAARYRRDEEESTRFPGFHVATIEWPDKHAVMYQVRLVSGGKTAFDKTLALPEVHEHILDWYGGRPAFDGVI